MVHVDRVLGDVDDDVVVVLFFAEESRLHPGSRAVRTDRHLHPGPRTCRVVFLDQQSEPIAEHSLGVERVLELGAIDLVLVEQLDVVAIDVIEDRDDLHIVVHMQDRDFPRVVIGNDV